MTIHRVHQVPPWPPYPQANYMLTRWECSCGWHSRAVRDTRDNREGLRELAMEATQHATPPTPPDAPLVVAARQLAAAWVEPGINPRWHVHQQRRLAEEWPTLYRAIEHLALVASRKG